jgi:hypothetical protein
VGRNKKGLGVDRRITLKKLIFMKRDGQACPGLICSENGQVAGARDCGNEHMGYLKCGEFLDT